MQLSFTEEEIQAKRVIDDRLREEKWAKLDEVLHERYDGVIADDIIAALRELYSIYSPSVMTWCANLFDPEVGGYYYSNSGRDFADTVYNGNLYKLLPDLESTYQGDGFVYTTRHLTDASPILPTWISDRIVKFVKSLQDKESGYFFHPQWEGEGYTVPAHRRGRDIQWAERLLKRYGASPTYDTPLGMKGDGILADGTPADMNGAFVYNDVPTREPEPLDEDNIQEHLRNKESFLKYLESVEERYDPNEPECCYWIGNFFESQGCEIVARDKVLAARGESYRLADVLEEWLNKKFNFDVGFWTNKPAITHGSVNGILKMSAAYNKIKKPLPDAPKLLETAINIIIHCDEEPAHVCSVLNPWYAVSVIAENANNFTSPDKRDETVCAVNEIKNRIVEKYPEMVRATAKNLKKFRKPDGSFSYYQKATAYCSQSMPVAHGAPDEGDLNATNICNFGIVGHIFALLSLENIPMFGEADRMNYIRTIEMNANKKKEG